MNRYLFDAVMPLRADSLRLALNALEEVKRNNQPEADVKLDMYYGDSYWDHKHGPTVEVTDSPDWGCVFRVPVVIWVLASDPAQARQKIGDSAAFRTATNLIQYDCIENY